MMNKHQENPSVQMDGLSVKKRIQVVAELESFYREKLSKVKILGPVESTPKPSPSQLTKDS